MYWNQAQRYQCSAGVEIESQKGEDETGWVKVVGKDTMCGGKGVEGFFMERST